MTDKVINLLSIGTLASNILIIVFLLLYFQSYLNKKDSEFLIKVKAFLGVYGNKLALIVAASSMFGSLFLSEIAKFNPCVLCWYQRILMYPIAILIGVGLYLKKKDFRFCVLPLSIFGILVSGYHYYLQNTANPFAPCSTIGFSVSCSERYSTNFGYITIPLMALTGFILITLLIYFGSGKVKSIKQG